MNRKNDAFTKINDLLEGTDYPNDIKDVSELEDFLNDVDNQQYDEFEEIERIYDELMDGDLDYEDE